MPRRRRLAIIGLGMAVTPHARSLARSARAGRGRLRVQPQRCAAAAFAERFAFPLTDDLEPDRQRDPSISAVMILTPPDTHLELVGRFAAAGKHILLEKPLERSTGRARARSSRPPSAAGVTLGVVFQHRFREASRASARALEQGALGELAAVNVICPWWRPQTYYDEPGRGTLARDGGGVLITQAIHTLDLLLSLTGPVAEVAAISGTTGCTAWRPRTSPAPACALPTARFGALLATTAAYPGLPGADRADRDQGHRRRSSPARSRSTTTTAARSGSARSRAPAAGRIRWPFRTTAHRALLADFLDALDQDRRPRVTGREALRVHRFIDAVLRASRGGPHRRRRDRLTRSPRWPTIRRSTSPRSGSTTGTSTIRSAGCWSSAALRGLPDRGEPLPLEGFVGASPTSRRVADPRGCSRTPRSS